MTMGLVVVKLGGSAVTVKDKPFTPNLEAIREVAKGLARSSKRLIIVLGGGSYGHQAVALVKEAGGSLAEGLSIVSNAMLELALLVADALLSEGIKTVIFPPHAFCYPEGLKPNCDWSAIARFLQAGVTPLTYGDVYPKAGSMEIVSGDELAVEAACMLRAERLVFISSVPGVFDASGKVVEILDRKTLHKVLEKKAVGGSPAIDVTGGMRRKLEAILENGCPGLRVVIGKAYTAEEVEALIAGKGFGTLIKL